MKTVGRAVCPAAVTATGAVALEIIQHQEVSIGVCGSEAFIDCMGIPTTTSTCNTTASPVFPLSFIVFSLLAQKIRTRIGKVVAAPTVKALVAGVAQLAFNLIFGTVV